MSRFKCFVVLVSVLLQLSTCVCQNHGNSAGNWIDPPEPVVTLDVKSNAAGVLQVGDIVEFTCTSHNHLSTATLAWKHVIGPAELREVAGHSPLIWHKTITQADHGTKVFCGVDLSFTLPSNHYQSLSVKSDYVSIQVQGASSAPIPPTPNGEKVFVSTSPSTTSNKIGDVLEYTCNVENAQFPLVEMYQVKGHLSRKIYTGYQVGVRWMKHTLSETDRGSSIICQAYVLDDKYRSIGINSEPYVLNIT